MVKELKCEEEKDNVTYKKIILLLTLQLFGFLVTLHLNE